MSEIEHRFVTTNDIRMHIAEQGDGPLVILVHGFPEFWYSWRHQMQPLADAGFRAVAPDMRGYGQTDCPEAVEAYDMMQLAGDIVGLVHELGQELGQEQAILVGHDFGAQVAYHCALFRPDLFRAVALLSVPYVPRSWKNVPTTEVMRRMAGDKTFYQLYFQQPGIAEAELDRDVRRSVTMFLYSASGSAPPEERWRFLFDESETLMDSCTYPERLPAWLSEEDIDRFTEAFTRSGFRGGVNWYRNLDRNWASTPFLNGAELRQPTLFLAGAEDGVVTLRQKAIAALEENVPNLTKTVILPGAGHWVQQESPAEVSRHLVEFLLSLPAQPAS
ncbi:MAG: alpha/beta hydrolase [Holophagales bacterium]|nr:alpha/beta hydrolase [Holophagales bacterium]